MVDKNFPSNSIILIVDQSDPDRIQLKKNLSLLGYQYVVETRDAGEALTKIESNAHTGTPISLILCDWRAARKGQTFLQNVRSSPFSKTTPIIMLSSNNELPNMLCASHKSINAYIVKPFTTEKIKSGLEAACQ